MELWIGPALTAALISGVVTCIGWFFSTWQNRNYEKIRRAEKVRDVTIAIAAEIAHNIERFALYDLDAHLIEITNKIHNDVNFTPLVPRYRTILIFDQIIGTIEILPHDLIVPTLDYFKAEYVLQLFVDDLRSDAYREREPLKKAQMYEDYVVMIRDAIEKGKIAKEATMTYLKRQYGIKMLDKPEVPLNHKGNGGTS
jgi:hypothetical protein